MNLIPSNSALYESPATPWETSGDARDARNTQLRANPREDPIAAILKVLRRGKRFLVCSHSWPDGDAVGSMIAIGMLLEQMGKHVDLVTVLAHLLEQHSNGYHAAYRIAVGPGMRADLEPLTPAEDFENGGDWIFARIFPELGVHRIARIARRLPRRGRRFIESRIRGN